MVGSLVSPYPLEYVTDSEMQKLTQSLWSWNICEACRKAETCTTASCPWRRSPRLKWFFDFYRDVTSFYVPELLPGSAPALRNHQDVFDIIRLFKARPNTKRSQLTQEYFSRRDRPPPPADQHRAFNLVVRVMSMVKCSADNQPSGLLELGTQPIQWHSDSSLAEFMVKVFPQADTGNLYVRDDSGKIRDIKSTITARRLKKVASLRFQGTDDLRNHLKMDVKDGVVEVFHYTSVLKEHLIARRGSPEDPDLQGSVSVGTIPRQVVLEVLDSMQNVLFPFDSTSEQILRSLVSKQSFDPDCLRYDAAVYRGEDEGDLSYSYFGSRLVDLFEELEDPSPRGILEIWFQRKSGARHVMKATLIGVIIAIVLGILGLVVGIFQAWVAYEAWKHPVNNGK
ncbi:hypothetical protein B0J15DRAFT_418963 [Fusarium solani]|uniref:Uncharacterized protein n=1 Tax=Fusarium solani TaxID=169388 RepID=A0A9P9R6S6_FUSSL|nr:uncharacterized protein B0J15DRAFT_418963 [Fusarium solani]KAH7268506.1 hypothetical protein B0J15DRAFT_418963 [Fusarium solani]